MTIHDQSIVDGSLDLAHIETETSDEILIDLTDLDTTSDINCNPTISSTVIRHIQDKSLSSAGCIVCGGHDEIKLRPFRILKKKRKTIINWTSTILVCFYHKVNLEDVPGSMICKTLFSVVSFL